MTGRLLASIIVPTCNREHSLLECVASLTAQDFGPLEILVIDQQPASGLPGLLSRRFAGEARIRYFHLERAGAARARNLGLAEARGEIVAFLDDDAVAEPDWLTQLAAALAVREHPGLVGGRVKPLWMLERPAWLPRECEYLLSVYDEGGELRPMSESDFPMAVNMAGRRDLLLKHGAFDERLGFNYFRKRPLMAGEETILGYRLRRAGHVIFYQPAAVVHHKISAAKLTRVGFLRRHFWEGVTTMERRALLGEIGPFRLPMYKHHGIDAVTALARAGLPRCLSGRPREESRMFGLAGFAYNCGLVFGLAELRRAPEEAAER